MIKKPLEALMDESFKKKRDRQDLVMENATYISNLLSPPKPAWAQGIKQDLATGQNHAAGISRQLPWAPAGLGGDKGGEKNEGHLVRRLKSR
jgi:hypothetical protein